MLIDKTEGALGKIKAFAAQHNKLDQLKQELEYLANYSQSETQCLLYTDFAPHSLRFVMNRKHGDEWKFWFNGGLIFHGNHDGYGSGRAPTLSCCLNPTDGWSIHT